MGTLHFGLESLAVRGTSLFLVGWVFDEKQEVVDLTLELAPEGKPRSAIAAAYGVSRTDIGATFRHVPHARSSGFNVYGAWRNEAPLDFTLVGRLSDGTTFRIVVPKELGVAVRSSTERRGSAIRNALVLGKRAWRLLRHGQVSVLVSKARRYLRGRPDVRVRTVQDVLPLLGGLDLSEVVLVIDHDLGGGANLHRERLIAGYLAAGAVVLMASYHVTSLQYLLDIRASGVAKRVAIPGWQIVLDLAKSIGFRKIVYNTGVSFPQPEQIPELLAQLKREGQAWLDILINDYFPVCPSHFLLNERGTFCGIPAVDVCRACLAANEEGFVTLYTLRDISLWRRLWGEALGLADRITVFSESSLRLLERAYPALDLSRAVVEPHAVDHLGLETVTPSYTTRLRIGVVGNIGYHKGARVIRDLAREIVRRGLDTRICIIGTIDTGCEPSVVSETGGYEHCRLPDLVRQTGANVFLFPSICPETFSFVVQELLVMQLPVACFDIGAPAERVREYERGLLLDSSEPSDILQSLIEFHQRLYLSTDHDGP